MDSLLNIGPCGDVAMGEPAFLSEEYDNSVDPCVELVTTSGHSKNGALSILQRSIKPQVLTRSCALLYLWVLFYYLCFKGMLGKVKVMVLERREGNVFTYIFMYVCVCVCVCCLSHTTPTTFYHL